MVMIFGKGVGGSGIHGADIPSGTFATKSNAMLPDQGVNIEVQPGLSLDAGKAYFLPRSSYLDSNKSNRPFCQYVGSGGSATHVGQSEQDGRPNNLPTRVAEGGTQAEEQLETRAEPEIDRRIPGV
jgi:hypothetical protein